MSVVFGNGWNTYQPQHPSIFSLSVMYSWKRTGGQRQWGWLVQLFMQRAKCNTMTTGHATIQWSTMVCVFLEHYSLEYETDTTLMLVTHGGGSERPASNSRKKGTPTRATILLGGIACHVVVVARALSASVASTGGGTRRERQIDCIRGRAKLSSRPGGLQGISPELSPTEQYTLVSSGWCLTPGGRTATSRRRDEREVGARSGGTRARVGVA